MAEMTPATILLAVILTVLIFSLPRKYAVIPFIVGMCFAPADRSMQIAGMNFYVLRILGLAGIFRLFAKDEYQKIRINTIDKLFYAYQFLVMAIYVLSSVYKWQAFISRSGILVDSVAIYWVFRQLLRGNRDIVLSIKWLAICCIILAPFACYEYFTAQNLFSIFGRDAISIRDGEIRAACTFSHAILFGSFSASLIPLIWGQIKSGRKRSEITLYAIALLAASFEVIASASSGPIAAGMVGVLLLLFFRWKQYSRIVTLALLVIATFIHFARKTPIWHFVFVRVSFKSSSTGYHRYMLIEAAIKEFSKWWLWGYGDAGPDWHTKYWPALFTDVTNHYLLQGVWGGVLSMLLFIALCIISIRVTGIYALRQKNTSDQWFYWSIMASIFVNCASMLSVAYFGQITMLLYLLFAMAALVYSRLYNTRLISSNAIINDVK